MESQTCEQANNAVEYDDVDVQCRNTILLRQFRMQGGRGQMANSFDAVGML